ncbi:MAG TPA: hypothetical protein VK871_00310 [Candidatus Limnocylindrales bacterium]|nr:hypothetical protein [Candidatus Limnocylindrales bacterium]
MRLTNRDRFATIVVAAGVLLAAGWFARLPGLESVDIRAVTLVILALGLPASAAAVIPGWDDLIHGSKLYMLGASLLGVAAAGAAVLTLVNGTEWTLVALVALTVVLWAVSTLRHAGMLEGGRPIGQAR